MSSTSTSRKAAVSKAAAARAEKSGEPKTVTWRELTLTLPAVLPGTLYFDIAALDTEPESPATQVRLLESLIGSEQVAQVRARIGELAVPFSDIPTEIMSLVNTVLGGYGMTEGESSASPDS